MLLELSPTWRETGGPGGKRVPTWVRRWWSGGRARASDGPGVRPATPASWRRRWFLLSRQWRGRGPPRTRPARASPAASCCASRWAATQGRAGSSSWNRLAKRGWDHIAGFLAGENASNMTRWGLAKAPGGRLGQQRGEVCHVHLPRDGLRAVLELHPPSSRRRSSWGSCPPDSPGARRVRGRRPVARGCGRSSACGAIRGAPARPPARSTGWRRRQAHVPITNSPW